MLEDFEIASRPVTNGEFLDFIRDGGAVYFEFKSENGTPANVWRSFQVDRMTYPSRASAKAIWQALNWKR